jgi:predicted nucleic acid-binding protein
VKYLLDTNVISELTRNQPNYRVTKWLENIPNTALYVSVLTLGEIRKGIEKVMEYQRREKLRLWLEHELPRWFQDKILSIDHAIADKWGRLQQQINRPLPAIDSLIAATALHHDLCLVTRNVKDFQYPLLEVINPWE